MAQQFGETPGEYVCASTARFAAAAGDEAWVSLIGAMERSADPGVAALVRMLEWALAEDTKGWAIDATARGQCGCHAARATKA